MVQTKIRVIEQHFCLEYLIKLIAKQKGMDFEVLTGEIINYPLNQWHSTNLRTS